MNNISKDIVLLALLAWVMMGVVIIPYLIWIAVDAVKKVVRGD